MGSRTPNKLHYTKCSDALEFLLLYVECKYFLKLFLYIFQYKQFYCRLLVDLFFPINIFNIHVDTLTTALLPANYNISGIANMRPNHTILKNKRSRRPLLIN